MKPVLFILLQSLTIFVYTSSYSQNYYWAKRIGGTNNDFCQDMAVDKQGNVYLIGVFQGTNIDFDPGSGSALLSSAGGDDIFFAKYDSLGNYLWAKSIGGTGDDVGARIVVDNSGNVYISGWFASTNVDFDPGPGTVILSTTGMTDIYFGKYDTDGNYIWAYNIGSSLGEGAHDICIDNKGHVFLTGYFYGTNVDFDPGVSTAFLSSQSNSGDIFFAKYNDDGTYIWAKECSGPDYEVSNGISIDDSGNVFITGPFKANIDFDPGIGSVLLTSAGGYDIFIAKYDSLGNYKWAHSIGSAADDMGADIAIDGSGNSIIACYFHGNNIDFDHGIGNALLTSNGGYDFVIAKYDINGNYIWAKQTGGTFDDYCVKVIIDKDNQIYYTGSYKGINVDFDPGPGTVNLSSKGNEDIYFAMYDSNGVYNWATSIGGTNSDFGNSIALSDFGKINITGGFVGVNVDFDPSSGIAYLNSAGGTDVFFASYSKPTTGIDNPKGTNKEKIQMMVYPNPTNCNTALKFYVPQKDQIKISIVNLTGSENIILLDKMMDEGIHYLDIDLSKYSAGNWILNLQNSTSIITRILSMVK